MKKSLLKLASAILSAGILVSLIPGAAVFADDETITVDGHNFVRQSDGLYKCSLTMYEYWAGSAHPYSYTYCLLTQDIINNTFGGTIPIVENPTSTNVRYYLGENITINHGAKAKDYSGCVIELQGRTITYDPENTDEYLWDAYENVHASLEFRDSYFSGDPSSSLCDGKITTPDGAPIARLSGTSSNDKGDFRMYDISVSGGYGTNYTDKKKNAFDLSGYAQMTMGSEATITSFSAEQGGAIRAKDNAYLQLYGTIRNCYATEGGAIYAEGRVLFGGYLSGNLAEKRGGGICLIGQNAHFEAYKDMDHDIPSITGNFCNSYEADDEGGGGIYVDSGYLYPVSISDEIIINNNNRNAGPKKNLHIVCDDNSQDIIAASYYNDVEFKVGISCTGFSTGDSVLRVLSYSKYSSSDYYTDRFVYEASGNSKLDPRSSTDPDNDKSLRLDFVYVEDSTTSSVLSGYSLITDGTSIGIKFYVSVSDADRKNYSYLNYTAKVSTVGDNKCYLLGNNEKTLTSGNAEFENGYYAYTYYVDSMDMTVPLQFELYKSGVEEPIDTMSGFTVRDYIDTIAKNEGKFGKTGVKAAVSIALYGAASQKYFNFRADDLADKNITADMKATTELSYYQKSYKTGLFFDPEDHQYGTNMPLSIPETEHLSFYGWTMSFKGKPSLKLYFLPKDGVTLDDLSISAYLCDKKSIYTKGNYIVIQFSDLTPEQIMLYTGDIYIYYGDEEETEMEIHFKPINYITRMMQKDSTSPEFKELCDSFYVFLVRFLPDYFENYYY